MNIALSRQILIELARVGVRTLCICPGARNAPLVVQISQTTGFEIFSFFDERSAAFFALGRARRDHAPVAVVTTSGTAVAELLPAVCEAYYSGAPLIVVTADRPRRLRGTGAPQSMEQNGLFQKFVMAEYDLEGQELALPSEVLSGPIHVNICFDEPLLDAEMRSLSVATPKNTKAEASHLEVPANLVRAQDFLTSAKNLLVIVSGLDSKAESKAVKDFILRAQLPVYLEATSGLREDPQLAELAIRGGDLSLAYALKAEKIGSVLRLGGIPTVRIWRDLEALKGRIPVLSISRLPFVGLSHGECLSGSLVQILGRLENAARVSTEQKAWLETDRKAHFELNALLLRFPKSETGLFRALSLKLQQSDLVYVGNSLPIREWDLAAGYGSSVWVQASRGVNGIDGQLSTFLGQHKPGERSAAIVGDLTALYDLNAFWPQINGQMKLLIDGAANHQSDSAAYPSPPPSADAVGIFIINNGGGKIFSRMFANSIFENQHTLEFSNWAKMWKLDYELVESVPDSLVWQSPKVFEICPDAEQTQAFWQAYEIFWKKL